MSTTWLCRRFTLSWLKPSVRSREATWLSAPRSTCTNVAERQQFSHRTKSESQSLRMVTSSSFQMWCSKSIRSPFSSTEALKKQIAKRKALLSCLSSKSKPESEPTRKRPHNSKGSRSRMKWKRWERNAMWKNYWCTETLRCEGSATTLSLCSTKRRSILLLSSSSKQS